MSSLSGKVTAVTGAGSGIGRSLAVGLARRGARLALSDIDEAGLGETVALVEGVGAEVRATVVDVSSQEQVAAWAALAVGHYGTVHQIYNNAGIAMTALPIERTDYATYRRVLDVNLWGVIHGTKEFLPHLIESGGGHVVNLSSLNGIMAQAGLGPYCASKFAVRGFSETLRVEMLTAGHPVSVTVVHPGGVRTSIAERAHQQEGLDEAAMRDQQRRAEIYREKLLRTSPADAADLILKGVEQGRGRVRIGQAVMIDRVVRLLPGSYPRLVARWERRTFGDVPS